MFRKPRQIGLLVYAAGAALLTLFSSCDLRVKIIEAPLAVRELAWEIAQDYLGMEYEWGGQDFPTPRG